MHLSIINLAIYDICIQKIKKSLLCEHVAATKKCASTHLINFSPRRSFQKYHESSFWKNSSPPAQTIILGIVSLSLYATAAVNERESWL